jgi:beta-glucosidase
MIQQLRTFFIKPATFFLVFHLFAGHPVTAQPKEKYLDTKLPVDERVDDLVSHMTLKEKVFQLFNNSPAIDRLGVPAYDWWNECLHGVARAGKATVFPQAIGLAATFDQDLMFRVADVISDEARAKHHHFAKNNVRSIYTGLTFWTPNINIFRDPRWGRGQETYGEDPYLTGRMGVNFIKGLQGNDSKYLKTVATAKHYAVHSGPEFTRHSDNIFVNDRDLYDTYLPAFEMVVKEAKVQSVMCAYNRFRDKPCCGNDLLLSNILRNKYGFDGYVVSDCGAITDFYQKEAHDLVETPEQAWGWAIASGTDLNCEESKNFIRNNLDSAIRIGMINESDINTSLKRLLKARFMLGVFDPDDQVPFTKIPLSVVGSEKHLKLSQEAAEKSLVLLKNNGILPLKNVKKVALVGPNADNFAILIGNYNGEPVRPVTPLKALREKLGDRNVLYSVGCPIVPGIFTNHEIIGAEYLFHTENGKLKPGLKAEYFDEPKFKGEPKLVKVDNTVNFYWTNSPLNGLIEDQFSVRWSGILIPKKSGTYLFGGNVKVKINDKAADSKGEILEKGKQYTIQAEINVESSPWKNSIEPSATLAWVDASLDFRKEALEAASKADVVIFCGGISADFEGEEMPLEIDGFSHGDRTHINLPKVQEDLLAELHKTGKPVVYVNFSGSAMALNWENENLSAIVQAFYPGEATGTALTRLLFGEFNPSGRLPITFYKNVNDLPTFDNYSMENRTYRYFKGVPLYPFGFGLSYTTFAYSNMEAPTVAKVGSDIEVKVNVTNTGKMEGEEVVQLYVSYKSNRFKKSIRDLKGFQRIKLKAGETKTVKFSLCADDLSIFDNEGNSVPAEGDIEISLGGGQPSNELITANKAIQKVISLSGR